MSGGQQQRVAIARALVKKPALILADEPTANLDSVIGREILELMVKLNRKEGTTFIFSTHDQMVMDFARRIVHIRDGRVESDEVKSA
jgi:putative ABC transport system ATP-binding protein